jgi:hypothetical protein
MKTRNVVLFVVFACFFLVRSGIANVRSCPPPQVRTLYTFSRNNSTLTEPVQDTHGNRCAVNQLGGPTAVGSVFLAYGQQEVDPTWFDPWAPSKVVAPASNSQVAAHKNRRRTGSAPLVERKTRVRHLVKAEQNKIGNR